MTFFPSLCLCIQNASSLIAHAFTFNNHFILLRVTEALKSIQAIMCAKQENSPWMGQQFITRFLAHIYTHTLFDIHEQFCIANPPSCNFRQWEETTEHEGNSCKQWENVNTVSSRLSFLESWRCEAP